MYINTSGVGVYGNHRYNGYACVACRMPYDISQHSIFISQLFTMYAYTSRVWGGYTTSRRLKIIGLFCKRALWRRRYSAKETYNFKEPTNRSHPIVGMGIMSTASMRALRIDCPIVQPIAFCLSFPHIFFWLQDGVVHHFFFGVQDRVARHFSCTTCTDYCMRSVISSFSNLNR